MDSSVVDAAGVVDEHVHRPIRLLCCCDDRIPLCRFRHIVTPEIIREDSQIRSFFVNEWPAYGKLMMEDVLAQLSASGYYRKDINIEATGAMIRGMIFFPLVIKPLLAREGESIEHYLDDQWIDFVATVFECYLGPQASSTAPSP
jgi:hypothetical protein